MHGTRIRVSDHEIALGSAYPGLADGSTAKLGIRPDYATLLAPKDPSGSGLPVQVRRIDDLGRKRLAHVSLGGQDLVATIPRDVEVEGSEARIRLDPERIHIYVDEKRVPGESIARRRVASPVEGRAS